MTNRISLANTAFAALALAGLLFPSAARAQGGQAEPLSSELNAYLVTTDAEGNERLTDAREIASGDIIEYRLTYHNKGEKGISGLAAVAPIPPNTRYVAGSATETGGAHFDVSLDNGASWHSEPVMHAVSKGGVMVEEAASPGEYSALRWQATSELAGGGSKTYAYRVQVK